MKKGFVFDLDGVITDTAKYHFLAWKELAEHLGISIDATFNESLKGISRMDSLNRILTLGNQENKYTDIEKEKFAEMKNSNYVSLLQNLSMQDLLPGVLNFLQSAKQLEVPCAIASASKNAPFILEKLKVDSYFSHIVDPDILEKGKPDPEIFIKAAESLGVLPSEAVGFEDAQAGVDGLKKAGLFTVGIGNKGELRDTDLLVSSLKEITVTELIAL